MAGVLHVVVIFFYVSLQTVWGFAATSTNLGIYGGHDISIEAAPFMVALYAPNNKGTVNFCGGSIIHKKFVLTAAHCLKNSAAPFSVWGFAGLENLSDPDRVLIQSDKKFCRKDYKPYPYSYNDICVLKLNQPLEYGPKVGRVTLPDDDFELQAGTMVNVTGWGVTETGVEPVNLRQVTVPIVPKEYCPITDRGICAGSRGRGTCNGDSGGPLTYNGIQLGVVSYRGSKECAGTYGTVYTAVPSFTNWIRTVIRENVP